MIELDDDGKRVRTEQEWHGGGTNEYVYDLLGLVSACIWLESRPECQFGIESLDVWLTKNPSWWTE